MDMRPARDDLTLEETSVLRMDAEVVIVGSGVVGSALATVLARDGRRVTVIERSLSHPDRIVGEVLHPGGIQALKELGLEDRLKHVDGNFINETIIIDDTRGYQANLPYLNGDESVSFRHGNFVDALRQAAQAEKNCNYIEGNVLDVIEEDGMVRGVIFRQKSKEEKQELRAQLTFISDGSFSRLRKLNAANEPQKLGVTVGMEYAGALSHGSCGEIFMTPDNSLHTYKLSPDVTRIFTNVRGPVPKDLTEYMRGLCQSLPEAVRGQVLANINKSSIRSLPSHHLPAAVPVRPGLITLGDALNMRHPVTASGMTVALKDILILRELMQTIPDLGDKEAICRAQKAFKARRKRHSFVINVFARCFYDIAFPPNESWIFIRSAALDYMASGGRATKDLTGILTTSETRPLVLLYHLTALTLFSAYRAVTQERWWNVPKGLLRALSNTYRILAVAIPLVWSEI